MCLAPRKLDDGTLVACRKCNLCRDNIIKDWAGRIVGESKTAKYTYFVALTYGRDAYGDSGHIRAAVLTYSDVQKYFKRLRKIVGKFKYFVVGEYGTEKGRAHWHVILFTQKPIDKHVRFNERYIQPPWDHGWSFFEPFHYKHAKYCCKYLFKDQADDIKTAMCQMSKKPPIGDAYFKRLAQQYVDAGLAPQDLFYSFPEIKKKDGRPVQFKMKGVTADNFLQHFINCWMSKHGVSEYVFEIAELEWLYNARWARDVSRRIPPSDLVEQFIDRQIEAWSETIEIRRAIEAYEQARHEASVQAYRNAVGGI